MSHFPPRVFTRRNFFRGGSVLALLLSMSLWYAPSIAFASCACSCTVMTGTRITSRTTTLDWQSCSIDDDCTVPCTTACHGSGPTSSLGSATCSNGPHPLGSSRTCACQCGDLPARPLRGSTCESNADCTGLCSSCSDGLGRLTLCVTPAELSAMQSGGSSGAGGLTTAPPPTSATPTAATPPPNVPLQTPIDPLNGESFQKMIGNVIRFSFGIVGALFFGMFVYGGVVWMIGAEDAKSATAVRKTIQNAVIGLFIVLMSFALVNFLLSSLSGITGGGAGSSSAPSTTTSPPAS